MPNLNQPSGHLFYTNPTRTSPMLSTTNEDLPFEVDNVVEKNALVFKPYPIGRVSRGKVTVKKGFYSEYFYENQDYPDLLYAYRGLCGFTIYKREEKGDVQIGYLKSNITGTKYSLETITGTFLAINYKTSWFKKRKPRTFFVLFYRTTKGEDITDYPHVMRNKEPYYNVDSNSYSLNFNGRVTTPSVKNFQLIHPLDPTYITLTFGKTSPTTYIMDHSFPLSAFSGFAIALAALDKKMFCD